MGSLCANAPLTATLSRAVASSQDRSWILRSRRVRVDSHARCALMRGPGMKTKAAVAYAAGKQLEVVTVDLDGPKAGEVLIEIRASGVCNGSQIGRAHV